MLETIITLLLIQFIVVNIIDLSGIVDHIKKFIWRKWIKVGKWYNISLMPIQCSYCMNHWVSLIYLLVTGQFSLILYSIVLLLSFLTPVTGDIETMIKEYFTAIINLLYKPISKNR